MSGTGRFGFRSFGHLVMLIGLGVGAVTGLVLGVEAGCSRCISPVGPNFGKEAFTPISPLLR